MNGDLDDIPGIHQEPSREALLTKELETISLQQGIFSIGSFMTFRLSEYDRRLKNYVEVSIEEYKMEQEYQNFIQSLRDYVMAKEPKLEKVHVVHQDRLMIWEFRYASERDQKQYIDRQFVREHPMYIDSQLIAPLVSIAPKRLTCLQMIQVTRWYRPFKIFFKKGSRYSRLIHFKNTMFNLSMTIWNRKVKSFLDFHEKTFYNTV